MYEGSETVVRCAVGTTENFKVKVGLHQGSALSLFLFSVIMDRLTDEIRREPPWMILFVKKPGKKWSGDYNPKSVHWKEEG